MIVKLFGFQFLGTASFSNSLELSLLVTRKNVLQSPCPWTGDNIWTPEAYQVL